MWEISLKPRIAAMLVMYRKTVRVNTAKEDFTVGFYSCVERLKVPQEQRGGMRMRSV